MEDTAHFLDENDRELHFEPSEACVSYRPAWGESHTPPAKKRKLSERMKDGSSATSDAQLPKLFDGRESDEFVNGRLAAFTHLWAVKHRELEHVLDDANEETTQSICEFIYTADVEGQARQLPAGLVNAGLASNASGSLYASVLQHIQKRQDYAMFRVHAAECHSLKAALKAIIQQGTASVDIDSEDEELQEMREGRRLLNYDLQALQKYVSSKHIARCVVFFQNSEALDPQVLAELVDVLLSWNNRIPFVLLFEMAISADLFQEKLSRNTVRQLRGASFESRSATEILDILFSAAVWGHDEHSLWIGAQVSRLLLDRQTEHIASAKGFIAALKYCYMMHFYHNPLSFLCYEDKGQALQNEHVAYLKNLPSFKRHLEILSGEGKSEEGRKLTRDVNHLLARTREMIEISKSSLNDMQHALKVLMTVNELTSLRSNLTYSSLYIKALTGDLVDSPIVRDLISSLRKLPSDRMLQLLLRLRESPVLLKADIDRNITSLRSKIVKEGSIVRSTYDTGTDTVRTMVKGQKVVLDKGKKSVDPLVAEYTKLVDRVDLTLVSCMAKTLVAPRDICFHEILIFDGKSAFRDVLGGAPRAGLERALSRPHDYLACSCCDVMEGQLAASQPATALVYQLYLESGATINIQDLWLAFHAISGSETAEDGEGSEDETLALFHRALAELRYLGMLKNNKRKVDHLAKVRWKGL